ncbi:hypothetical protein LXM26_30135 [Dyadobacter sp. LJ419]|uniref:Uncharacterized protein n=1 Tax=Dyadobacter chenwenxiniae TaxID=2906456 RepID=A0A9X1PSS5_9BACT|nr:hypothetical protein [Dyadobacter chenwenxiniae]MCF0065810.1 hypothetical protein [Dyadobacter chenwenxiniae]
MFGPVPAATNFEEFLKKLSIEFQQDVLGLERAKRFRTGERLEKFVDQSGHVYTLKELARREKFKGS